MRERHGATRGGIGRDGWITTYKRWTSMMIRAVWGDPKDYPNHIGRGITVCDRWKTSYTAFLEDMGECPSDIHQLDRFPNNDGNYEPGNCRWALPSEQLQTRRKKYRCKICGEFGHNSTKHTGSKKTEIRLCSICSEIGCRSSSHDMI
jgi:hypothetical protein